MNWKPKFLSALVGGDAQGETGQGDHNGRGAGASKQAGTPPAAETTGENVVRSKASIEPTPSRNPDREREGERDERPGFFRREPDAPFNQHDFRPRAEFLRSPKTPRILISEHAYRRMCLIVELAPQEVGWLGTVERMPSGNFYIDEIFVPEQDVTGTETDPTDEGQFKVMNELAEMGEEGMQKIEKLRFWGHSHVRMMTTASGTDENTPLNYQRLGLPWFIRGIFNKLGRAEFTVYLFEEGYRFLDVPWIAVDAQTGETLGSERTRPAQGFFLDRENDGPGLPTVKLNQKLVPGEVERKQVEKELAAKLKPRSFGGFFSGWGRDNGPGRDGEGRDGKGRDGSGRDNLVGSGATNRGTTRGDIDLGAVTVRRDSSSPPDGKE
jgi:hypothetical protein